MFKKSKNLKTSIPILLLIITLFFCILSTGSANEGDKQLNDSKYDDENAPLPNYGPESFEKAKNETGFITTRGTMPVITDANEKVEWTDLLIKCSQQLSRPNNTTGIRPYFVELSGPVNSFGTNINGYLIVGFEASNAEKVNESVIDEIYKVIDEHCKQENISDVPVVFIFVDIKEEEGVTDELNKNEEVITVIDKDGNYIDVDKNEAHVDKDGNLEIKDNKTTQRANGSKPETNEATNKMPGFTSIIVILGFLLSSVVKHL